MNVYKGFDILLAAGICGIWILMIVAKNSEYDFNYGFFIYALLISFLVTLFILTFFIVKTAVVRHSTLFAALFFLTSSPPSLLSFVWLYQEIVGQYFKL